MAKGSRRLHPALKAQSQMVKMLSQKYKKQGKKIHIGQLAKEAARLVKSGKRSHKMSRRSHKKSRRSHKKY